MTPDDVLNVKFAATKFRDGYDQDEVDAFLDRLRVEFAGASASTAPRSAAPVSTTTADGTIPSLTPKPRGLMSRLFGGR